MLQELIEKYEVLNIFAYHQLPPADNVIKFGWKKAELGELEYPVVISVVEEGQNNITSLKDYRRYFSRLTSLTPDEFIERWDGHPRELGIYWEHKFPNADAGQSAFIMKLAFLIRDGKPFSAYNASFKIYNSGESLNDKAMDTHKI